MDTLALKGLLGAFVLISAGFVLSACNTTKATADTFAKFTSSTSPSEWISVDGVIQKDKQARLFAAVAYENLEQNIARGNGEYLTSLGVLLDIPAGEEKEFASSTQRNYPLLFAPERRTAVRAPAPAAPVHRLVGIRTRRLRPDPRPDAADLVRSRP